MAWRNLRFCIGPCEWFMTMTWKAQGIISWILMLRLDFRRCAAGVGISSLTWISPASSAAARAPASGMKRMRTLSRWTVLRPAKPSRSL